MKEISMQPKPKGNGGAQGNQQSLSLPSLSKGASSSIERMLTEAGLNMGHGFVPNLEQVSGGNAPVPPKEAMSDIFQQGSGAEPQQAARATMTMESLGLGEEDLHALRTLYGEGMKTRNPTLEQNFMQLAQDVAAQSSAYNVNDVIGAVEKEYGEGQKPKKGDPYPGHENLIYNEIDSETGKVLSVKPAAGYTWDKEKGGHAVKLKEK